MKARQKFRRESTHHVVVVDYRLDWWADQMEFDTFLSADIKHDGKELEDSLDHVQGGGILFL